MPHSVISPAVLFWGTPVILITTENEDGTFNISPMSSAWWFAHRAVLGVLSMSKTAENMVRTKKCVLNMPSENMTSHINLLSRTTGTNPVPAFKAAIGYQYVQDKFAHAKLTPQDSDIVRIPRVKECPVQMEAEVTEWHEMMADLEDKKGLMLCFEVKIVRTHVLDEIRLEGYENRIDTQKWKPLFMMFSQFYGRSENKMVEESELAKVDEESYRGVTETV